jgi:hypothetical protein
MKRMLTALAILSVAGVAQAADLKCSQIKLVVQEPDTAHPHGLHAAVMEIPVGQLRGSPSPSDPSASKYIGIFYDQSCPESRSTGRNCERRRCGMNP